MPELSFNRHAAERNNIAKELKHHALFITNEPNLVSPTASYRYIPCALSLLAGGGTVNLLRLSNPRQCQGGPSAETFRL
eukprot:scaffold1007_cov176-Amphora_coffeaeformis.AAC.31